MKNKTKVSLSSFKRSLIYLNKYKLLVGLTLTFALIYVASSLIIPILIGMSIDKMVYGQLFIQHIADLLILTCLIAVAGALAQWGMSVINNRITFLVARDMRKDAFSKIHKLPIKYLDSHPVGDIVSRIISDVDQFSDGMLMGFTQLFTGVMTIVSTLVFMLVMNPIIAIVVVTLTPLSIYVASLIANRTHRFYAEQSAMRGKQTGYINEMIENVKTVKAFSREDEVSNTFTQINKEFEKCTLKATFYSSLVNPTTRFVNSVVYAVVAGVGAIFACGIVNYQPLIVTVGELSVFLQYVNQYTKPFNEISGVIAELQNAIACADRFYEFLNLEEEIEDRSDAVSLMSVKGNITFENVNFSYSVDKPLMSGINIDVKAGQKVAIVGPTGCGKTTLINLLLRFYDVDSGRITVDGHDIRNITRHSLRSNYGMVLQETWIKTGTIRENLKLGNLDISDDEMIEACKRVHCHGFITRLENGYDTVVDENGSELSAGQKQLLCIARAMISDPPILILDEATSSIDTRTEINVQNAMRELMEGRTSFVVAHRLSTIMGVDMILVMKDGNIIEQGTHTELLDSNGFYSEIFNSQFADA